MVPGDYPGTFIDNAIDSPDASPDGEEAGNRVRPDAEPGDVALIRHED
jgi:hypothetical protein